MDFKIFINAIKNDNLELVKELIKDEKVDPSTNSNEAILFASTNGHLKIIKELLKDKRVDPSTLDNYAICLASLNGHLKVVKELLKDKRVNPSASNNCAIRNASKYGHLEIVKELLKDKRVNPSIYDNESIRLAAKNGHLKVVKELIKDKRVDWRVIKEKVKNPLLLEERNLLRKELTKLYIYLENVFPYITFRNDKNEIIKKSEIPRSLIKKICYLIVYLNISQELCEALKTEKYSEIKTPPIKLVALANIINITFEPNISLENLCGKKTSFFIKMI